MGLKKTDSKFLCYTLKTYRKGSMMDENKDSRTLQNSGVDRVIGVEESWVISSTKKIVFDSPTRDILILHRVEDLGGNYAASSD